MAQKERKVVIMGSRSVGKSSLCIQFVNNQFGEDYDPTIENTFSKLVNIHGHNYGLELIDTAGQDEHTIFPPQYSMDVHGFVLVYSITSQKSFQVVHALYDKITHVMEGANIPIVLVGNKTDLGMERVVSTEQGKKVAEMWKAVFLETTAKENEAASEVFMKMLTEIQKADGVTEKSKDKCCVS